MKQKASSVLRRDAQAVRNPSCYPGDKQAKPVVWLANGSAAQVIYPTLHSVHFHLTLLGISQFGQAATSS